MCYCFCNRSIPATCWRPFIRWDLLQPDFRLWVWPNMVIHTSDRSHRGCPNEVSRTDLDLFAGRQRVGASNFKRKHLNIWDILSSIVECHQLYMHEVSHTLSQISRNINMFLHCTINRLLGRSLDCCLCNRSVLASCWRPFIKRDLLQPDSSPGFHTAASFMSKKFRIAIALYTTSLKEFSSIPSWRNVCDIWISGHTNIPWDQLWFHLQD